MIRDAGHLRGALHEGPDDIAVIHKNDHFRAVLVGVDEPHGQYREADQGKQPDSRPAVVAEFPHQLKGKA